MKGIYRSTIQAICVIFLGILFGVTAHAKNLNLQQIKALSYKQFELKEGDKLYEVYLFSEDGEEQVATIENTLAWGGIYDGDTIVTGHFKLAYALKGTQEYKIYDLDELLDGEQVTLDITSQYINKISNNNQGISDFLTFFIPECSTGGELYVYEIINGSLHAIPFSVNGATSPYIWVAITNKQGAEFSAIGNLKYKGVLFSNANIGGYFMNIYKYNTKTKMLEQSGDTTRWVNEKYKDYPFSKPYKLTNKEIKDIILGGHSAVVECFDSSYSDKIDGNMFLSQFRSKKELAMALEAYWSKEYVQKILQKYRANLKETKEGLYISLGDFGYYYNLYEAVIIKVEDYGSTKKKVYLKAESEGEGKEKILTYILVFTNHGWVLQDGGSNPKYA